MLTISPTSLEKGLRATFLNQFAPQLRLIDLLCFMEKSDSDKEGYEWLGPVPQMALFERELISTPLTDTKYEITNDIYAASISVRRKDLEDNKLGSVQRRISQMAAVASEHADKLLIDTIIANGVGYDGVAQFHDTHPIRNGEPATQDNLLAGSGTTTSAFATDFAAAKANILSRKAENGEPFHGGGAGLKWVVLVPVQLERAAREALNATIISNTTNVLQGQAEVIAHPRLVDVDDWYTFAVSGAAKPYIFQDRVPLEFSALEGQSDNGFFREEFHYKTRYRVGAGNGFWQCGAKTVQ